MSFEFLVELPSGRREQGEAALELMRRVWMSVLDAHLPCMSMAVEHDVGAVEELSHLGTKGSAGGVVLPYR